MKKIELTKIAKERAELLTKEIINNSVESVNVESWTFDEDLDGLTNAYNLNDKESNFLSKVLQSEFKKILEKNGYYLNSNENCMII